jgi:hypothetical protein
MQFAKLRIHGHFLRALVMLAVLFVPFMLSSQSPSLDCSKCLHPKNVIVDHVFYRGRKAIRVRSLPSADAAYDAQKSGTGGGIVMVDESTFHNGTIDIDVAGMPQAKAPALARGFVGIAFRVPLDASNYDYVYIRPANGRADDQVRRNHSTQYAAFPNFEWLKLRTEFPGKYESYVDLVSGEWTHLKIKIDGVRLRLFVNGATQSTLLVNDLKLGDRSGGIALWIGVGTEAYFANLQLKPQLR